MCLLGSPAVPVDQSVDAVVTAAAAASAVASTKSARRRVRQRMVKKLAPVMGKEDLQELVAQFKTSPTCQAPEVEDLPSRPLCAQAAAILPVQLQTVYMPIPIQSVLPPGPCPAQMQIVTLCAPQVVHQLGENIQVPCIDATVTQRIGKQTTPEVGVCHKREIEKMDIQVARTFVQFDTWAYERQNARMRSKSV